MVSRVGSVSRGPRFNASVIGLISLVVDAKRQEEDLSLHPALSFDKQLITSEIGLSADLASE